MEKYKDKGDGIVERLQPVQFNLNQEAQNLAFAKRRLQNQLKMIENIKADIAEMESKINEVKKDIPNIEIPVVESLVTPDIQSVGIDNTAKDQNVVE